MKTYQDILLEYKEQTALITINRPKVYNALTKAAKHEIVEAIGEANEDPKIRSLVLTGEGKAFCTGQDLNDRGATTSSEAHDLGHTLETEWNPLIRALRYSKKPIIGAINGVVAGAGVSLAVACDMLVSAPQMKFISGFSKLGLCPDAGVNFALTRALGRQKALEFFLFNQPLKSEELHEKGVINCLDEVPLRTAMEWCTTLNGLAPLSVQTIKENVLHATDEGFKEMLVHEVHGQRKLGRTQDYQEGIAAFFEKRAPEFKGK